MGTSHACIHYERCTHNHCQSQAEQQEELLELDLSHQNITDVFGRLLRKARKKAHLTSPEHLSQALCDLCGVHHTSRTIYRYETGAHSPSLDFLVASAVVFSPQIFYDLLHELQESNKSKSEPAVRANKPKCHRHLKGQLSLFDVKHFDAS
jgi:transcriptional regulator with XRE-family HTH domain